MNQENASTSLYSKSRESRHGENWAGGKGVDMQLLLVSSLLPNTVALGVGKMRTSEMPLLGLSKSTANCSSMPP